MTWLHRPTSCHDTALSIGTATANSCQKQSPDLPKEAVPKRVQSSGGVGRRRGPQHGEEVGGRPNRKCDGGTQQQRKEKRGERRA